MGETTFRETPSRVRFGVLGFLCSLSLLTYLDRICIMRVEVNIRGDLGFDTTQMGLVLAAFYLGYTLFEIPAGWMGDAWGSRSVLTRIVLLWSVFTAMTGGMWAFSSNAALVLTTMMLVRFIFGCGEAGAFPNVTRISAAWFPSRERGLVLGLVWTTARFGGAIAPLVMGRLTALLGWRWSFVVLGGVGVAWAVLFYRWFRNRPEEKASCNAAERALIQEGRLPSETVGHAHLSPPWKKLLQMPSTYAMCVASAAVSFAWYFFATWIPLFYVERFGLDPESAKMEIITGLPLFFGAIGSFLGGWLSDRMIVLTGSRRWGRSLMAMCGFGLAGSCFIAAGFATTSIQATTLLCLAAFFNDFGIPPIWAACADIGGRFAGTLSGIMNMAGGIGSITLPAVIPILSAALEPNHATAERWQIIFAVLTSGWIIGAAAWAFINAAKPIEESEPTPHAELPA